MSASVATASPRAAPARLSDHSVRPLSTPKANSSPELKAATTTGPATAIMEASLKAELAKTCPGCTVSEVNVEVPQWQTQIAGTVTAQLLQHPNVTVLFPDYADMLTSATSTLNLPTSELTFITVLQA